MIWQKFQKIFSHSDCFAKALKTMSIEICNWCIVRRNLELQCRVRQKKVWFIFEKVIKYYFSFKLAAVVFLKSSLTKPKSLKLHNYETHVTRTLAWWRQRAIFLNHNWLLKLTYQFFFRSLCFEYVLDFDFCVIKSYQKNFFNW